MFFVEIINVSRDQQRESSTEQSKFFFLILSSSRNSQNFPRIATPKLTTIWFHVSVLVCFDAAIANKKKSFSHTTFIHSQSERNIKVRKTNDRDTSSTPHVWNSRSTIGERIIYYLKKTFFAVSVVTSYQIAIDIELLLIREAKDIPNLHSETINFAVW